MFELIVPFKLLSQSLIFIYLFLVDFFLKKKKKKKKKNRFFLPQIYILITRPSSLQEYLPLVEVGQ